jgi:hypothetical protein
MELEINDINNLVFDYVIYIIKRREFDIYNITEDQYEMNICHYLMNWDTYTNISYWRYFIIRERKFKPSINALTYMVEYVIQYKEEEENETPTQILNSTKDKYYVLKNYAYYYIFYMGYEKFLLELKKYV